jgi:glycosyltransferase involved in cell wall biosynthesis
MANDDIAIVLAIYNGEKYLNDLMDSLVAQGNVCVKEIIVIDDCSTDRSAEVITAYQEKFPYICILKNEFNQGPIRSFIKGAKLATAKYVAFADQDDIWIQNKLALTINAIKKADLNKPAVVFTDLKMIDENNKLVYNSFWDLYKISPRKNSFFTILFANIATGCTMLINQKMVNEFVNMPTDAQMHDHWIALVAASFGDWQYLEDKTVLYRIHQSSVTNKNKVTISKKISNFLEASFNKNSTFLNDYIHQACLFKLKYESILSNEKISQIDYFINLKNSTGFVKKLTSKFRFFLQKK